MVTLHCFITDEICVVSNRFIHARPSIVCSLKVRMHSAFSTSDCFRFRMRLKTSTAPRYVLFISKSVTSLPLQARTCAALPLPAIFARRVKSLSTHFSFPWCLLADVCRCTRRSSHWSPTECAALLACFF